MNTALTIDPEQLADLVADKIIARDYEDVDFREYVRDSLTAKLEKKLDAAFSEVTTQILRREVEALVAEGWYRTSSYGERTGEKITIRDRLRDALSRKDGNYGNDKSINTMARQAIDAAIQAEAKGVLAEIKELCSKSVKDALIGNIEAIIKNELSRRR